MFRTSLTWTKKYPSGILFHFLSDKIYSQCCNLWFVKMDHFFAVHAACVTITTSRGSWRTERKKERKRRRRRSGGRGWILIMEECVAFISAQSNHLFIYSFIRYYFPYLLPNLCYRCTSPRTLNPYIDQNHIKRLEILWNSMNGSYCHCNNIDPWRRDYLTEQIPSVSRLSYSPQCPMQIPRHNQMQQHDAFITLSVILIGQYWNKTSPRPVIELKKTPFSGRRLGFDV